MEVTRWKTEVEVDFENKEYSQFSKVKKKEGECLWLTYTGNKENSGVHILYLSFF